MENTITRLRWFLLLSQNEAIPTTMSGQMSAPINVPMNEPTSLAASLLLDGAMLTTLTMT
jgi:hypothetical protein